MSGLWGWICWYAQITEKTLSWSSQSCTTTYWARDKESSKKVVIRVLMWKNSSSCYPKYFTSPEILATVPKSLDNSWEMRDVHVHLFKQKRELSSGFSLLGRRHFTTLGCQHRQKAGSLSCWNNFQIASPFFLVFLFQFGAANAPPCSMELKAL